MTVWWDELAVTALLGTDRRGRPDTGALPEALAVAAARLTGDPAGVLLDTAALAVAYRRAGVRSYAGVAAPAASPAETLRQPTPRAVALLAEVLGQDPQLLLFWCETAAAAGLVAPEEALPALLERAVEQPALRSAIVPVLGVRGRWLASMHTRWSAVTAGEPGSGGAADPHSTAEGGVDPEAWRFGDPAQRVDWLLAVRRLDPQGALATLAGGWPSESGRDRAAFVAVLEHGLSGADEDFLETALDDRAPGVRAAAAELLARLPSSRYAGRMRARATALVRVERALLRSRVIIEMPDRLDQAAGRDGLTDHRSGRAISAETRRTWWLEQVVGAAPLDVWPAVLGSPEKAVRTGFDDDTRLAIRAGWAWAAVRQRNAQWAEALLRSGSLSRVEELVALLGPDQLTPVLLEWLAAVRPDDRGLVGRFLAGAPGPWPQPLAQAACGRLPAIIQVPQTNAAQASTLLHLIAFRSPPTQQSRQDLAAVAAQLTDAPWRGRVQTFVQIIAQRIRIHEELQ